MLRPVADGGEPGVERLPRAQPGSGRPFPPVHVVPEGSADGVGGTGGTGAGVYAASEGLATLVLEPEAIDGHTGTSSLIRNYPGFPTGIRGNRLAFTAYLQAWAFGSTSHRPGSPDGVDQGFVPRRPG